MTEAEFHRQFNTNVLGPLLLKLWLADPRHGAPEIEMRRLLDRLGDRFVPLSSLAPGCFRNF